MAVARYLVWLGPVVGLAVCAWHNQVLQPWTLDDAYISFRYAESFARGDGLVYNPGERVEGYTTFLWVFLLGVGNALGAETRTLAKVLGVLFATATLGLLAFAHRVVPALDARAGAVAAALVGSCGIFSAWVMPGMEVPLVALLITGTGLAFAAGIERGHGWVGGVVGALAMMARPDSIVWVGVMSGWAAWMAWRRRARTASRPACRGGRRRWRPSRPPRGCR